MVRTKIVKKKVIYAFIDAANLFYGGEKSLGWKIDYKKLLAYLKTKFGVSKAFYYAGVDVGTYKSTTNIINLDSVVHNFHKKYMKRETTEFERKEIYTFLKRIKFYEKLDSFGYKLRLKPTKVFHNGKQSVKKANCDVDLTFDLMRYISQYTGLVILSGDGDFAPVLDYLRRKGKSLNILARSERTAKEIRQLAGGKFMDFTYIKTYVRFKEK